MFRCNSSAVPASNPTSHDVFLHPSYMGAKWNHSIWTCYRWSFGSVPNFPCKREPLGIRLESFHTKPFYLNIPNVWLFFFSEEEDSVTKLRSHLVSSMSFFPSLCVVRSLPTLGHILSEEARERSFASLYEFRGNSRVKSGLMKKVTFNLPDPLWVFDKVIYKHNSHRHF